MNDGGSIERMASALSPGFGDGRAEKRSIARRVFVTCWLVYVTHFATNTVRELYPALSLGDHLSFDVSEYQGLHPDLFEVPGRGWFINNNPGASILAAIPYTAFRPIIDRVGRRIQQGRERAGLTEPPDYDAPGPNAREFYRKVYLKGLDVKFGLAAAVSQVFLMAPLSAFSAVVMLNLLRGVGIEQRGAILLTMLYAFATPVFFRTGHLNQNLLVSHCALMAFSLIWQPGRHPGGPSPASYFLSGLLSGWAVVCDYSGLLVPVGIGFYALIRRSAALSVIPRGKGLILFVLGVCISGAVLAGYQWSNFGHPLYPAQHYMPPARYTHAGYAGMDWPQADLLWDTAFSARFGIFTSAPLLILALWVPSWFGRKTLLPTRELIFVVAFCVSFFTFCAANQYGRMQFNCGVRHVVPVTPFLFLLAAGTLGRCPPLLAVLTGVFATYWSWCLTMYRDVEFGDGVIESIKRITLGGFQLPWLKTLERMGSQWPGVFDHGASAVPILTVLFACVAVIWRVQKPFRGTSG